MNRREFLSTPALALAPGEPEQGFTSLFDGKTLKGWTIQDGPQSAFYADAGDIAGHDTSGFPAWLRSEKEYENFDLRLEFFLKGWMDGGVLIHAPEHGRPAWAGMLVKIFHQYDKEPQTNSMGAILPVVAPKLVNVRAKGEWNSMRILMDWPRLQVWVNGEVVQDIDCDAHHALHDRLRQGFLGLSTLSYPLRFRNLRIRELPSREKWETLFETDSDMDKWFVSESNQRAPAQFRARNGVIWADGLGHLATKKQYRDFELQLYIRHARHHNGGVLFRTAGKGLADPRHYEIQLHDVEDAHFPTGSLYYHQRSVYPRIEPEKWYLMQVIAKGRECMVRVDGQTIMMYDKLENIGEGHIELQAHQAGRWTEFKRIRAKKWGQ
jgi:hypothetical protein